MAVCYVVTGTYLKNVDLGSGQGAGSLKSGVPPTAQAKQATLRWPVTQPWAQRRVFQIGSNNLYHIPNQITKKWTLGKSPFFLSELRRYFKDFMVGNRN